MENTSNYGLKRWDGGDRILHTEFNDNWDKIDTALKSSADGVAALQTALASCGNCKIVYGTYTGNGKYGKDNPNQLTLDGNPLFVIIKGSEDKAAAALAAATALEQKMGLQHIQTVNGTTGDCSIFTYSIDWDQWTEVLFFLTPKLSGSNLTYQLSFENRAMTSDGSVYFSGTLGGDSSFVVYPFSSKNTSLKG